ncbi:MAG TPA: polysaccharide biosynthesis tyrosine autokinase [Opitutaceae bacterium]|nr:polysaccharide biosynthesis tyrosine autokinase [Opitutaceae bacterium]
MSKDPATKEKQEGAGQGGYAYGGYSGYGYGYGDEAGASGMHRTLHDYLLILRERIWYIVVVFLVVFSSALVYTLSLPKIYQASASLHISRTDPTIMEVKRVVDTDIRTDQDLNTQIKLIESGMIADRVAQQLARKPEDLRKFLTPYERTSADVAYVSAVLGSNRKVSLQRLTLFVLVSYQHPNPEVAATVANLFAQAYLDYNRQVRSDASKYALNELNTTIQEQQKRVERLAKELQAYKEAKNMPSLDAKKNIVEETLKTVNAEANRAQQALSVAETRLNQVKERRAKGADLTELPFISSQSLIVHLTQQAAAQKITIAQLEKRYKAQYPAMIKEVNQLQAIERELKKAIEEACTQIESDYQAAERNFQVARQELKKRSEESLELDRLALEYNDRERELKTQEQLLQTIITRQTETSITSSFAMQNARVVDPAVPPPESRPVSPNVPLNLGLGIVGGLGLGLAFAFFVAFIDDRVKSSFDIEGVVGLPLIGVIPQIKRMDQSDKAQIVMSNADRLVAEAFLTLHSSLRLKEESKNAKCILITSTVPGEGKSFTTTNLALTYASHGERVAIVDCDLRKPNIHKSFKIDNARGVIDVCTGKAALADVVVRNVQPNLDIIPAGGRAKNPTQILNSKGFEDLVSDLRKNYDRVFFDTPPLAAVSDALIILPLVDGSIFTIFFNKVRRKAAQFSAKKILESTVPNFGAILNGLNLAVSGYYYAQYYDKSYKDYYVTAGKDEDGRPTR